MTIDTLRADHLSAYGYERPTSPFLERLARGGALFENAFAASSMTAPCHASLFTGLYPLQHGVRMNGQGFEPATRRRYRTLAELLARAGYATAAFSGVGFLRSISPGFETIDAGSGDFRHYRQADTTVDAALAWIAARPRPGPLFIWVHLFDPHPPRRLPRGPLPGLGFASPAEADRFARDAIARRGVAADAYPSLSALAESYASYDTEISFTDHEIGRLFDSMQARGLNQRALWIVTADHGEGLGNHGWTDHVRYLYNEAVRVPLIFYGDRRWAGTRVRDLVRQVDVAPTVLALLGLPYEQPGYGTTGRSILPLLEGGALPPAMAFSVRRPWGKDHRDWERGEVFALQDLEWKYVAHTRGKDEVFDLRRDPLELRNLVDSAPPVMASLERLTRATFAGLEHEGRGLVTQTPEPADTEELNALGYIQ